MPIWLHAGIHRAVAPGNIAPAATWTCIRTWSIQLFANIPLESDLTVTLELCGIIDVGTEPSELK